MLSNRFTTRGTFAPVSEDEKRNILLDFVNHHSKEVWNLVTDKSRWSLQPEYDTSKLPPPAPERMWFSSPSAAATTDGAKFYNRYRAELRLHDIPIKPSALRVFQIVCPKKFCDEGDEVYDDGATWLTSYSFNRSCWASRGDLSYGDGVDNVRNELSIPHLSVPLIILFTLEVAKLDEICGLGQWRHATFNVLDIKWDLHSTCRATVQRIHRLGNGAGAGVKASSKSKSSKSRPSKRTKKSHTTDNNDDGERENSDGDEEDVNSDAGVTALVLSPWSPGLLGRSLGAPHLIFYLLIYYQSNICK